jgi:CRP-like cAMP-binding protein
MIERLTSEARADFESLLHGISYPYNVVLFTEGDSATGVYVVLEGEIRVSISSADAGRLNLRIARKHDLLGLSSMLSGGVYNATAETLYPAKVAYIAREDLLAFSRAIRLHTWFWWKS